jgi:hypothetical protein
MSRDLAIFLAYGYGYAFILGMIVGVALTGFISAVYRKRKFPGGPESREGREYVHTPSGRHKEETT